MAVFQTPLEKIFITEVVQAAKICYDRGWCFGTAGNFSIKTNNKRLWQSPRSKNKGSLDPEFFIPIDLLTGQLLEDSKISEPSQEMPVHRCIYLAKPAARSVVHCHPPYLVKYSDQLKVGANKLGGGEMIKALGAKDFFDTLECGVISNLRQVEMEKLESLENEIKEVPAIILKGHGVYAWGADPHEALAVVEALEFIAQKCL